MAEAEIQDPPKTQPPPQAQAPAQESSSSGRRTEADLRAELAAERVSKADIQRTLEARATKAEADLAKAQEKAQEHVTAEVTKVTERLTKMQARVVEAELKAAAQEFGLRDPDLLLHPLLERTKITVSEDGEVAGVKDAFEALKTKKPEWFGTTPPSAGAQPPAQRPATGGPAPQPGGSNPPPANVIAMSKDEYTKYKNDFRRNLRSAG